MNKSKGKRQAKKPARGGKRAPRRGFRKARDVPDLASLSVTSTLVPPPGNPNFITGLMYSLMNTNLSVFPRAVQVAKAYQHYRIKKITLRLKPAVDTFAQGGASKTYLYYMIDKAGALPSNPTLELLKIAGAKAHTFDEKTKSISWRPSVLADVASGAFIGSPNKYTISPWLSTNINTVTPGLWNPSNVDHLGIYWFVDQQFQPGYGYSVECTVEFQFKKPIWSLGTGQESVPVALKASLPTYDSSPDGIAETPNS